MVNPTGPREYRGFNTHLRSLLTDLGAEGVQQISKILRERGDTPWRVLGVDPLDPVGLVTEVYRVKAKWFHPDNPRTGNELRFRQIKEAYEAIKGERQGA